MNSNLPRKAVKENFHNHINCVWREKESEGGGEESAHGGTKGGEVSAVENGSPFSNWGLNVHVQEDISPLSPRLFSEMKPVIY